MKTTLFIATLLFSTPAMACDAVCQAEWDLQRLRSKFEAERIIEEIRTAPIRGEMILDSYRPRRNYFTPRYRGLDL